MQPLGLPGLPLHLRLDPLSGFFLALLGAAELGVTAPPATSAIRSGVRWPCSRSGITSCWPG